MNISVCTIESIVYLYNNLPQTKVHRTIPPDTLPQVFYRFWCRYTSPLICSAHHPLSRQRHHRKVHKTHVDSECLPRIVLNTENIFFTLTGKKQFGNNKSGKTDKYIS